MIAIPKSGNRDKAYWRYCQDLARTGSGECFVTGERVKLVAHHVLPKGVNGDLGLDGKGNIVIIVIRLHVSFDDSAHGLGHYTLFDEAHNCDSLAEAHRLYTEYQELNGGDPS